MKVIRLIERRDILKGLTVATGGLLLPRPIWSLAAPGQTAPSVPLVLAVRALVRKDGRLLQPIEISVQHAGTSASAMTGVDGVQVDSRPLVDGLNTFLVLVEPVTAARQASVTVTVGSDVKSATVTLQPTPKITLYVMPMSHHDLGYTEVQSKVEDRQAANLMMAIDLARKTADYPEGSRFVWNLEVLWSVDQFLRRRPQADKDALFEAVRKGWVAINAMYANELTGLCRPEELLQLFRYSETLRSACGVKVDTAMLSDVPGFTWGTVTAMAQAGVRYFSAAPNSNDRIGTLKQALQEKPFWLQSPSGKERVLVWIPAYGYGRFMGIDSSGLSGYMNTLDNLNFSYDIACTRWSHGDNAQPDAGLPDKVRAWNEQYEWPKVIISSASEAFAAFEKRHGNEIPVLKGDVTPYWEDGAGSTALETAMNRNSADRLTQAETLAVMLSSGAYRAADYTEAWRNVLLYSEHTWGAAGSVTAPESQGVKDQWEGKRKYAVDGEAQSKALLAGVLQAYGGSKDGAAIDLHNSTSWPRSEVVLLETNMSAAGDAVTDDHGRALPSQRLSTGELAVRVEDVPAFGSVRLHVVAKLPVGPARPVSAKDGVLDNGVLRVGVDASTGDLVELSLAAKAGNLIDTSGGEAANEYLYVEGKEFASVYAAGKPKMLNGPDVGSIQKSGPVEIQVVENGPLVAMLRIVSQAPGCNSLVREVRLNAEADWVEISNIVDKKPAPLNSDPNQDVRGAYSQYGGKESVHFVFPFAVPGGKMHMDIPLGEMQPEIDQLPGSSKNWLPVSRWVDVANESRGVTWVTLDAPLIEVGELSATLAGGQRDPALWRTKIAPTQRLYSWAMNNYWGTNYKANQESIVRFRYAVRAHKGYDPAAATRFAAGLSQSLVASRASAGKVPAPLLRIEPQDVLGLALKPSDDGGASMLRLFGASGQDRKVRLTWPRAVRPRVWVSDLSEKPITQVGDEIDVAGWDLVTLRVESKA